MKGQVIVLESVAAGPRERISAPEKDTRYSPSYVDVGTLQLRACQLSARWRLRGSEPFPQEYLDSVEEMIEEGVRGVEHVGIRKSKEGYRIVTFTTEDDWGAYSYSFLLKPEWFCKN